MFDILSKAQRKSNSKESMRHIEQGVCVKIEVTHETYVFKMVMNHL